MNKGNRMHALWLGSTMEASASFLDRETPWGYLSIASHFELDIRLLSQGFFILHLSYYRTTTWMLVLSSSFLFFFFPRAHVSRYVLQAVTASSSNREGDKKIFDSRTANLHRADDGGDIDNSCILALVCS